MTRKFLMTVAIIAIALAPSIGIGPAQAHGFGGGFHGSGFGGHGFYAAMATVFTADTGVVSAAGMAAAFTAGMAASIRATMGMAIPRTVTTATDRVQLAAGTTQLCTKPKLRRLGGALDFQCPTFSSSCWSGISQRVNAGLS